MTYDLRRLRLHGLIERVPGTLRYLVTDQGIQVAVFYSKVYARIFRPAFSVETLPLPPDQLLCARKKPPKGLRDIEKGLGRLLEEARIAA